MPIRKNRTSNRPSDKPPNKKLCKNLGQYLETHGKRVNGIFIQKEDWELPEEGKYITYRIVDAFTSIFSRRDDKVLLQSWFFISLTSLGWDGVYQSFLVMAPLALEITLISLPFHFNAPW